MTGRPLPQTYRELLSSFECRDPEVEDRIASGIHNHRQGWARLQCVDAAGQAVRGVKIAGRLTRHDFLFGANAFMLDGYDTPEKNAAYEQAFGGVLNSAVVPFFWSGLEPEPGKLRFAADSPKMYRRPAPDRVLEFCDKYHLTPKGHCLFWHSHLPEWLPQNRSEALPYLRRRFQQIAERYGQRIKYWDVFNEPMEKRYVTHVQNLPEDCVYWAFNEAKSLFPAQARLILNEAQTGVWREYHGELSNFYLLVQNLVLRGMSPRGLGFQYHLFFYENGVFSNSIQPLAREKNVLLDPKRLLAVMDLYGRFGLPLNISEITLPTYQEVAGGEQFQADLLRELYRLWFSHPQMEAIYWWNLADGGAHGNEGTLLGGLLDAELKPKLSYLVLKQLIQEEWTTRFEMEADREARFHGFYGRYELTTEYQGTVKTHAIHLDNASSRDFTLKVV